MGYKNCGQNLTCHPPSNICNRWAVVWTEMIQLAYNKFLLLDIRSILFQCWMTLATTCGYLSSLFPLHAYSHSASVGSRFPIHLQYSTASFQDTCKTGWSMLQHKVQDTCNTGLGLLKWNENRTIINWARDRFFVKLNSIIHNTRCNHTLSSKQTSFGHFSSDDPKHSGSSFI